MPNNYLISYPRSGNTAVRYLLEQMTGRPSNGICGPLNPKDKLQQPLIHTGTDYCILKQHDFKGVHNSRDFVLFVLRDPLEAVIRHNQHRGLALDQLKNYLSGWFDLLLDYDQHKGPKMLFYYDQVVKVADRASRDIYPNPQSNSPTFHQDKLPNNVRVMLNEYIKYTYPSLVTKYLKK